MSPSKSQIVALLFAISLFNYIDRWSVAAIINDLQAPPKKGGFGLTDLEGGLVTSVFIFTYMILSPIFGYFGDRAPRIPLIFCGIVAWSASGLFSSFAAFYWQFLIFRALVGVGEASYAVLAPTLIADLYTGTERTRVLGVYTASVPLGSAMGYIYAGEVARMLEWRWAFRFTPFIGILLAVILLCFVPEPTRGDADGVARQNETRQTKAADRASGLQGFVRDAVDIWRIKSFFWSTFGAVGMTFTAGALAQWATALLQRVNCDKTDAFCEATITRTFGIVSIVAGVTGCLLGPTLSKWYSKRDPAGDAMVSAIMLLMATPFVFLAIHFADTRYTLTWFLIFIGETMVSVTWPLLPAIQLSVVPPEQRNTANGISLTVSHILGDSISPVAVGVLADKFRETGTGISRAVALQQALYITVVASFVGGFFFLLCARSLPKDREMALVQTEKGYRPVDTLEESEERIQKESVEIVVGNATTLT